MRTRVTADTSQIVEASLVDSEVMVKRVFKVAELLTRYVAKLDGSLGKNRCENLESEEIEYCRTEDQQQM